MDILDNYNIVVENIAHIKKQEKIRKAVEKMICPVEILNESFERFRKMSWEELNSLRNKSNGKH